MIFLDLRTTTQEHPAVGSLSLEVAASQPTRFVWMRVCQECLCPSINEYPDGPRCAGCGRSAILSPLEDRGPV